MSDDLVARLRVYAEGTSRAEQYMAEAKSKRNQAAGDEGANYSWSTPEQTLEWRAADEIERLHSRLSVLEVALRPFADIKPSTCFPNDGSENEGYDVVLAETLGAPDFRGSDLARARAALSVTERADAVGKVEND